MKPVVCGIFFWVLVATGAQAATKIEYEGTVVRAQLDASDSYELFGDHQPFTIGNLRYESRVVQIEIDRSKKGWREIDSVTGVKLLEASLFGLEAEHLYIALLIEPFMTRIGPKKDFLSSDDKVSIHCREDIHPRSLGGDSEFACKISIRIE